MAGRVGVNLETVTRFDVVCWLEQSGTRDVASSWAALTSST